MSHQTSIVAYRKLSNGQFAVQVRCCSDVESDSWITLAAHVETDGGDQEKRKARIGKSITDHSERVAALHEAAQATEEHLKGLVPPEDDHAQQI